MISSPEDGYIVNLDSKTEGSKFYDFDKDLEIESIKSLTYDPVEQDYYIMCNKFQEKLGFFVLRINAKDTDNFEFLIKWKNKLDINDTSMFICRNEQSGYKELVTGFKSIYINCYNLFCIDISQPDIESILFRHESFQLWESESSGYLLHNKYNDFVTLNKTGM